MEGPANSSLSRWAPGSPRSERAPTATAPAGAMGAAMTDCGCDSEAVAVVTGLGLACPDCFTIRDARIWHDGAERPEKPGGYTVLCADGYQGPAQFSHQGNDQWYSGDMNITERVVGWREDGEP